MCKIQKTPFDNFTGSRVELESPLKACRDIQKTNGQTNIYLYKHIYNREGERERASVKVHESHQCISTYSLKLHCECHV